MVYKLRGQIAKPLAQIVCLFFSPTGDFPVSILNLLQCKHKEKTKCSSSLESLCLPSSFLLMERFKFDNYGGGRGVLIV